MQGTLKEEKDLNKNYYGRKSYYFYSGSFALVVRKLFLGNNTDITTKEELYDKSETNNTYKGLYSTTIF